MRKLVLAAALLAGVEGAALACSCIAPGPPEESRGHAREAVQGIAAIVEAEALSEFSHGGVGEQVRVHRTLFGQVPPTLRIERPPHASSASCDLLLSRGQRKLLILTPGEAGAYRMQSLCSDFLTAERYLPILLEEAARGSEGSSRAGERADNCPRAPRVNSEA